MSIDVSKKKKKPKIFLQLRFVKVLSELCYFVWRKSSRWRHITQRVNSLIIARFVRLTIQVHIYAHNDSFFFRRCLISNRVIPNDRINQKLTLKQKNFYHLPVQNPAYCRHVRYNLVRALTNKVESREETRLEEAHSLKSIYP